METNRSKFYNKEYDLENCSKEPLHQILRSQSYGSFICCNEDGSTWFYVSTDLEAVLETKSISDIILEKTGIVFVDIRAQEFEEQHFFSQAGYAFSMVVHRREFGFMIELEPTDNLAPLNVQPEKFQDATVAFMACETLAGLLDEVTERVYDITGFERIMVYAFDEDYSGEVVEERKPTDAISYKGLKFPASDIPEQARKLYFQEKVRIINDATDEGHYLIQNATEEPIELDTSKVTIRGVSPIHAEYLRNIGVQSSFSVAIIEDEKLWGLIACHHSRPKFINHKTRGWLRFLSNFISTKKRTLKNYKTHVSGISNLLNKKKILESVTTTKDLTFVLLKGENNIQTLVPSSGALVMTNGVIEGCGEFPNSAKLNHIVPWLKSLGKFDVKVIQQSSRDLPSEAYSPLIAGMLIVQLSHLSGDYLIWLRKEKAITVEWAGDPSKTKSFDTVKGRLTPRKSFDKWKEVVENRAESWTEYEINIANALKIELREQLYHKYNQVVALNSELREAYSQMEVFSYSVSHDLKAPLRSIEGFSQILKEDYSSQLDEHGLQILNIISESIGKMNAFIHEILNYSKLNKSELDVMKVDLNDVIKYQWKILISDIDSKAELLVAGDIPDVYGDLNMINQLMLNLLSNSLKYIDDGVDPVIKISHNEIENFVVIHLEDNGIGIAKEQREKVFEVFRRLVREDDYEGTGVGLSIVKKVLQRHGGYVVIKDRLDEKQGSRFEFSLPTNRGFLERLKVKNED